MKEQFNLMKRKNAYNEGEQDYQNLPEENMVVMTWINDMGNVQREFDVRWILVTISSLTIGQDPFLYQ
jgi:hypothetical protein